jgi:hypothetical protein
VLTANGAGQATPLVRRGWLAEIGHPLFLRLTTSTFDILKTDLSLGRAEALHQSMLAYMNDDVNGRFRR